MISLGHRLCHIADQLVENRDVQISDATLRTLRDEVHRERMRITEEPNPIGYEATCLIECVTELAWARSERDDRRVERAVMYLNAFRHFLRADLDKRAAA